MANDLKNKLPDLSWCPILISKKSDFLERKEKTRKLL